MQDNSSAIHHSSFTIPHFRNHAAADIPKPSVALTGVQAGPVCWRSLKYIAVIHTTVPGARSSANGMSTIARVVFPCQVYSDGSVGAVAPTNVQIAAPFTNGG